MDNALLLYLKKLEQSMYAEFDDVLAAISNVQLRVDDIYFGNQLSEWVSDLETFGKSSVTYQDASRMSAIVSSVDACKNENISTMILEWAVSNNKVGTYFGSILDNPTSVSWASLSTPANVIGNSSAFTLIGKDTNALSKVMNNSNCKVQIFNQRGTTESVIRSNSDILENLRKYKTQKKASIKDSNKVAEWNGNYFVFLVYFANDYKASGSVKMGSSTIWSGAPDGTSENINKFANYLYIKGWYISGDYHYDVIEF